MHRGRRARRSGRTAGGLLTVAVVAAGLAASLGAGYTVAQATLDDASTYVAKGNAISHVNGESHQVDATSPGGLAKDLEDVDTTPLPNGKVVAVNRQTGKVSIVDGSTLQRTTALPGRGSAADPVAVAPQAVATDSGGWLLDYATRTVRQVGGSDQKLIRLDGKPVDGAPGRDGSLIVLTESGQLYQVTRQRSVRELDIPDGDGRGGALTSVGGHSYLVQTGGTIVEVDSGQPVNIGAAEGAAPLAGGRMLVNSPRTGGPHLLVVVRDQIDVVDLGTGEVAYRILHRAGTDELGEPVEYRNRIYLPDYANHRVLVLDEQRKLRVDEFTVPGSQRTFFLSVDGNRLWANDQYSTKLIEFDTEGRKHTIDKGSGNGVRGDAPTKPNRPNPPRGGGVNPPSNGTTGGDPGSTNPQPDPQPNPTRTPRPSLPDPAAPAKRVTVPDIAPGENYQDACAKVDAVNLNCQAVAVGDDGGDTDTVKDVLPEPGTRLPEGSQVVVTYYGPVKVPQVPSGTTTPADQCKALEAATLTCDPRPADGPAPSADQFGYVDTTSPAPGEDAGRGDTVTVYYYDSLTMPQFTDNGTSGTDGCTYLARTIALPNGQTKTFRCTSADGTKANNQPANVGKVYEQAPAANTVVHVDDPVTLTVYGGRHTVANYASDNGGDADAAVRDCQQWFSACDIVQGTPAIGHAQDAGKVEKTDPGAGTAVDVGSPVHISVFSGNTTVPPIAGLPIDQACQKVVDAGLICDRDSSHPDAKSVGTANPPGFPSNPAEGAQAALGSTVVVPNATTPTVDIMAYPNADGTVFVVRPAGSAVPAGYDAGRGVRITTGYRVDAHPNWNINEFYCANCDGHAPNHFVSHGGRGTQAGTPWEASQNSGGAVANLIPPVSPQTCNTQIGQVGIWRVSNDRGGGRIDYGIVAQNANPGTRYPEFLGCGWQ